MPSTRFLICALWLVFFGNDCVVVAKSRTAGPSIKATLIAEHSRKTHKDYRSIDSSVETSLVNGETAQQRAHRRAFEMASGQESAEPMPLSASLEEHASEEEEASMAMAPDNPFKLPNFDESYKTHSLCEEWNSGRHGNNVNLEYTESADRLLKIIGNGVVKNGYNMFMAPGQSQRVTTNVSVAVYIESMSSFRAQTMDFEVDMYLAMGWYDRRLAHNCTHPILVTHKFIADRIWQPDLYFVNSKFAYLQEVTTPNFMLIVYPDGLIFKSMRIDVTLSCMMDLKRFPTDKQECPMVIQSYAYVENLVNLSWHNDPPNFPIGSNAEIKLNDMIITNTRFEKCEGPYPMFRGYGNWSCVRGFIVMKRLVLFHVIQTYAPTGMLVCISWMSFWLDPRASPARITLTITTLLTLTTMSNGARQDLPQVAYIKMLDLWLSFNQVLIFLVLLEYTIVSHFLTKRTMDCEHRKNLNAMGMMSGDGGNVVFPKSQSKDRLRQRSESPIAGITSSTPLCSNGVNGYIRHRHASIDNGHGKLSAQNSLYSMSTGLGQCLGNSAMLCRLATINNNLYARRGHRPSWSDIEAETTALMSGTNHTNMPYYNKTDLTKPCTKCAYENEMIARKIDTYARIIFPSTFVIFCSAYWFYYSWWDVEGQ